MDLETRKHTIHEKKSYFEFSREKKVQVLILPAVCEVLMRKSKATNLDYNKSETLTQGNKCERDWEKTDRSWNEQLQPEF